MPKTRLYHKKVRSMFKYLLSIWILIMKVATFHMTFLSVIDSSNTDYVHNIQFSLPSNMDTSDKKT